MSPREQQSQRIDTGQMQLGPGLFVRIAREFGFPTLVAIALAGAWFWQNSEAKTERLALIEERKAIYSKFGKRLRGVEDTLRDLYGACAARPGMSLPLAPARARAIEEDDEEDARTPP